MKILSYDEYANFLNEEEEIAKKIDVKAKLAHLSSVAKYKADDDVVFKEGSHYLKYKKASDRRYTECQMSKELYKEMPTLTIVGINPYASSGKGFDEGGYMPSKDEVYYNVKFTCRELKKQKEYKSRYERYSGPPQMKLVFAYGDHTEEYHAIIREENLTPAKEKEILDKGIEVIAREFKKKLGIKTVTATKTEKGAWDKIKFTIFQVKSVRGGGVFGEFFTEEQAETSMKEIQKLISDQYENSATKVLVDTEPKFEVKPHEIVYNPETFKEVAEKVLGDLSKVFHDSRGEIKSKDLGILD